MAFLAALAILSGLHDGQPSRVCLQRLQPHLSDRLTGGPAGAGKGTGTLPGWALADDDDDDGRQPVVRSISGTGAACAPAALALGLALALALTLADSTALFHLFRLAAWRVKFSDSFYTPSPQNCLYCSSTMAMT